MDEEFKFEGFGFGDDEEENTSTSGGLNFDDEDDSTSFSGFGDDGDGGGNQQGMGGQGGGQGVGGEGGGTGGDMFGGAFGSMGDPNNVYATRKQAYVDSFKGGPEQIQIKQQSIGIVGAFKKLLEINGSIYKELNIIHYILIGTCAIILGISLFFLKELLTYILSYLTIYTQGLIGVDKFLILTIYFFGMFYVLNYLDGVSKLLNTIQLPIKIVLLLVGVLYLIGYISSDLLFSFFVLGIFPLVLMKLFIFNETDTGILERIKNGASIEDLEVKQEINNIINKASDSLLGDLPEQQELLIGNVESEEEEKYQLWFEMLNRNKEEKKLSGFLVGEKMNLYFLNYIEEEMPVV